MKRTIIDGNTNLMIEQRDTDIELTIKGYGPNRDMQTMMEPGVARQIGRLLIAMADALDVDLSWEARHPKEVM